MLRTLLMSLVALFVLAGRASAIEEPKFRIVRQYADFEVRDYAPYVVAETMVSAGFEDAGNEGFRRLFDYISGKNAGRASVTMTAPVIQAGQKIAMTAPVLQSAATGSYVVRFVMPASATLRTLPAPDDRRVMLREIPSARFAVIRYSGFWSEENYRTHLEQLRAAMAREHLNAAGDPVWARYDPPFMPWFLRRNEILIPVGPAG